MPQQSYEKARKRVKELKGFYSHLIVYIFVNILLIMINLLTDSSSWWFIYSLLGWGIGLATHGLNTFVSNKWGRDWEERKIKELLSKDNE